MIPNLRLLRSDEPELADALWRESLIERLDPAQQEGFEFPSIRALPTARAMCLESPRGEVMGTGAVVLPGMSARFGFEQSCPLPDPRVPARRDDLGEGFLLYMRPAHRRGGYAWALAFLAMLLAHEQGAGWFAAENGAISLSMAKAVGFIDTGLITRYRGAVPYHLMVGRTAEVLAGAWPAAAPILTPERVALDAELRALVARWRAGLR